MFTGQRVPHLLLVINQSVYKHPKSLLYVYIQYILNKIFHYYVHPLDNIIGLLKINDGFLFVTLTSNIIFSHYCLNVVWGRHSFVLHVPFMNKTLWRWFGTT